MRVVRLVQSLSHTQKANVVIGKQLLRLETSVAVNYRAACRAQSIAEFKSKISVVFEEVDECLFWMELLMESGIVKSSLLENLYHESEEMLNIVAVARKNAKT